MEKHYVFLKNNIVEQIAVFNKQDEKLANLVAQDQGYEEAIWVEENIPSMWSSYNGLKFTEPTKEYLISRGIITITPAVVDETIPE
jgi:hypothetical protein